MTKVRRNPHTQDAWDRMSERIFCEMQVKRIQRRRSKGFNLQDASPNGLPVVYVGRPSKWGNPFNLDTFPITLSESLIRYRKYIKDILAKYPDFLDPLKGKNLACWCPLDQSCHADILLEFLKER